MSRDSITASIPLVQVRDSLSASEQELNEKNAINAGKITKEKSIIELPWQAQAAFVALLLLFITIGASYFWITTTNVQYTWIPLFMTILWLLSGTGVLILVYWIWREFSRFGDELSKWVDRLHNGELSARMSVGRRSCPSSKIRGRLNTITDDYQMLAEKLEQRFSRQKKYIEQKKHYLNVLYDVASCINRSKSLEDLLQRFLYTLKDVVNAEAATVRLLDNEDQMRLVASIGLSDEIVKKEEIMPAPQCLCGKAALDGDIKVRDSVLKCGKRLGQSFFDAEDIELIAIPLQYRDKTLGVYNLFVSRNNQSKIEVEHELLMSIGQHLGMAIEKASVEEEAHLLSIIEERTRMAHELHDSLAQTLASLRFKVRLFDDSLHKADDAVIWQELEGLEKGIDDAYAELRSLITHFRAPMDGKGIVRSVERLVERFRMETGLEVFFYHNWNLEDLDREIEIEAVRIVQEALANIRKHAQAETVRILMYSSEEGECRILVEDDGIGLSDTHPEPDEVTGEHIGLTVMQERANRIKGEIQFESEDGEGTLVQLNFKAHTDKQLSDIVGIPQRQGKSQ
jgi:two-component system nitrate/nitrite sensor histidine kinase NarX